MSAEPSASPSSEPPEDEDGGIGWLIPLGLAAIGGAVAFVWWQSRKEPPDDLQGPDGAGPPPPVAPGDIQDVRPGAGAVAPTEPTPPPAARAAGSKAARELFGDEFVEHFAASREWEDREFRRAVTDWELARYFEII